MVDSVHRYNKKIEGLNYEYNQMLSSTVSYSTFNIISWTTKEHTLRNGYKSSIWRRTKL